LIPDVQQLSRQARDRLLRLCDEALETYTGRRGRNLYDHRRIALGDISGTARYEVLKRAGFRCDLCGISAEERALEVDHILPRHHAGTERRSATNATPTRLRISMTPQLYGAGAIWGARRA
jgi:ATP adenylyltransferase